MRRVYFIKSSNYKSINTQINSHNNMNSQFNIYNCLIKITIFSWKSLGTYDDRYILILHGDRLGRLKKEREDEDSC